MNQTIIRVELQSLQDLYGYASDQVARNTLEIILFQKIV